MRSNICGHKIREHRKRLGMAQIDLAAAMNVDYGFKLNQSDISEIELKTRGIRDFELKAFAEIFDVPLGQLFE